MREDDHRHNTYKRARKALKSIEGGTHWNDWLDVIDALGEARREAFEEAGITDNRPVGPAYTKAFGTILNREKLHSDVLDTATRSACLQIFENRAVIEIFRTTLTTNLRQTHNNPGVVWRHYKRHNPTPEEIEKRLKKKNKNKDKPTPNQRIAALDEERDTLAGSVSDQAERIKELEEELFDAKARITELEAQLAKEDSKAVQAAKPKKPVNADTFKMTEEALEAYLVDPEHEGVSQRDMEAATGWSHATINRRLKKLKKAGAVA